MPKIRRQSPSWSATVAGTGFHHIISCCNSLPSAKIVLSHAIRLAESSAARITLLQVLEPSLPRGVPIDPLVWDLNRRTIKQELSDMIHKAGWSGTIDIAILDGAAAERICEFAASEGADVIAMGTCGSEHVGAKLGSTARHVISNFSGAILLVPPSAELQKGPGRLMVPLDCSTRAEIAVCMASHLAKNSDAELLLAHAQRSIEMPGVGPFAPEVIDLRVRLEQTNVSAAERYLKRMGMRLPKDKLKVKTRLLTDGDPRRLLLAAIVEEKIDLVILTNIGMGGSPELPLGSTADYLATNSPVPVLIVRVSLNHTSVSKCRLQQAPIKSQDTWA